jgi:hypothetical protein
MRLPFLHVSLLASAALTAFAQREPDVVLTEKISAKSPDGKYGLRIMYNRAINDQLLSNEPAPEGGIFSHAINALAIVSLPGKEVMADITKIASEGGNQFDEICLIWSPDSKWCAFHHAYPRVGYTNVFQLRSGKFERVHSPYELESFAPVRWVKPGVLEIGDEHAVTHVATFHGKGGVKLKQAKKKR